MRNRTLVGGILQKFFRKLFLLVFLCIEQSEILSYNFIGPVTLNAFSALIPIKHATSFVQRDHHVIRYLANHFVVLLFAFFQFIIFLSQLFIEVAVIVVGIALREDRESELLH